MPNIAPSKSEKLHQNQTELSAKISEMPNASAVKISSDIANGILRGCLDAIRSAPAGESNHVLNTEAFKVGQLVKAEAFSYDFAAAELYKAAMVRGKPDYESRATIKSGLDGGLKNPIMCPFPSTPPLPAFELPPVNEARERWTPSFLTRQDLLNRSNLRKPQLFKDWSTRDITITTADGGTGKTTIFLNEAIALALGDRFLGFDNKAQGKTLFITGEDTDKKLAATLGEILRQMGLFEEGIENEAKIQTIIDSIVIKKDSDLCLISKDKQGFLIPNPEAMRKLKEAIEDIKPINIVIDPIASFWGSESALNDMNKAVTKFMAWLVEISGGCVHAINHMGKSSSANKDMSQFAGRGGSGLPSNSRVSRVLRPLSPEEYKDATGSDLVADQSAMMCNVNKFTDGSPLLNKPFIIIREGYLFRRVTLTPQKEKELEQHQSDNERVMKFIKEERESNRYPTAKVVIGKLMTVVDPIPMARTQRALSLLEYDGFGGERIAQIDNPNSLIKDRAYTVTDIDGKEII